MTTHETHLTAAEVDLDRVGKVSSLVTIQDVRLAAISGHCDLFPNEVPSDWAASAQLGYDTNPYMDGWREDPTSFRAVSIFTANWVPGQEADHQDGKGEATEDAPIELLSVFEVVYDIESPETLTELDLEHFAALNTVYNAWPYWRAAAQSMTVQMQIPPLVVPVFRVPREAQVQTALRRQLPPDVLSFLDEVSTPTGIRHALHHFLAVTLSWPDVSHRVSRDHLKGIALLDDPDRPPFAWVFPKTGKLQFRVVDAALIPEGIDGLERGPKGMRLRLRSDEDLMDAISLAQLAYRQAVAPD